MFGFNRKNKAWMIAIDQGLTKNSVSEHHSIKLLLTFNS